LELRDKLPTAGTSAPTAPALNETEEDVLSALVNLGYQRAAAEKALAGAVKTDARKSDARKSDEAGSFDALFREALAGLSK